jgi:hypothetical protein
MRLGLKCQHPCKMFNKKHDVGKLSVSEVQSKYQQELSDLLAEVSALHQTVDQMSESYSTIMKTAADKILGNQRSRKKPWISDSTLKIVDERRLVKKKLATSPNLKPEYNHRTHRINACITSDYEQWCNVNSDKVELYQHTHQTRSLYKKIKELTSGTSSATKCNIIKDKTGVVLAIEGDVRKRWIEYCEELYNYDIKSDESVLVPLRSGQHQEPECMITLEETKEAIEKLKPMKAPGVDGVC